MTTCRFNQVIFADDFFRSAANGLAYHDANRRFLRGFFESALGRLALPLREEAPLSVGGRVDVARLMARLDLPCTPAGWARACIADLSPLCGFDGMPVFDTGCLVIGWGLTPAQQHCIDRSGASYLDIEIDPRRFTEHLHFCARTNDPLIEAALQVRRVNDELFWNHAAAIKGCFARRGAASLFDTRLRVGLFFGQSLVDLSLISGGRTMHPASVVAPLRELAQSVDLLVIKPHPYEPALHDLAPIARAIPNVAWTQENTYALLSAANVHFAASLSSSVLTEARYFRKPVHALIRADRNARTQLPATCSDWIPIGPELGAVDFMAAICGIGNGRELPRSFAAWPSTAVERAFSTRWGLDPESPGLREVPELQLGRPYAFRPGSPAVAWLSHGWAMPGAAGVASDGEMACLVIPLPGLSQSLSHRQPHRLEVRIDYRSDTRATSVHAMFDGVVLPGQRTAGAGRRSLVFDVQPTPGRKCLVLQFVVADVGRTGLRRSNAKAGFTIRRLQVSLRTARGVVAMPPPSTAAALASSWSESRPARVLARVFRALLASARGVTG